MSVGSISSISSAWSLYPINSVDGTQDTSAIAATAMAAENDAAAEVIEYLDPASAEQFSRDFPQILMQQAFAVPMTETEPPASLEADGDVTMNYLWQGDSSTSDTAETADAIPGTVDAAETNDDDGDDENTVNTTQETKSNGEPMTEEEQVQVQEMRNTDKEVRAHEQAHQAVGGRYAGGASYEYTQGPDGQRYAISGEVPIDVSAESDPEATIAKMQQVRAAALAPAEPSSQDRAVAATAQQTEMRARVELTEQQSSDDESVDETATVSIDESTETTNDQNSESEKTSGEATAAAASTLMNASINAADASSFATEFAAGISSEIGGYESAAIESSGSLGSALFIENAYRIQSSPDQSPASQPFMVDPLLASAIGYRSIDVVA